MRIVNTFFISLLFAASVSATNNHPHLENPNRSKFTPFFTIDFNKIFFFGEDESVIFIDFQAFANPLASIVLKQEEKVMMIDEVSDLPFNAIYELNLEIMRPGQYTLELETEDGIKILKDIRVE